MNEENLAFANSNGESLRFPYPIINKIPYFLVV